MAGKTSSNSKDPNKASEEAQAAVHATLTELFKKTEDVILWCRGRWNQLSKSVKERNPLGLELLSVCQGNTEELIELFSSDRVKLSLSTLGGAALHEVKGIENKMTIANGGLRNIIDDASEGLDIDEALKKWDISMRKVSRALRDTESIVLQDIQAQKAVASTDDQNQFRQLFKSVEQNTSLELSAQNVDADLTGAHVHTAFATPVGNTPRQTPEPDDQTGISEAPNENPEQPSTAGTPSCSNGKDNDNRKRKLSAQEDAHPKSQKRPSNLNSSVHGIPAMRSLVDVNLDMSDDESVQGSPNNSGRNMRARLTVVGPEASLSKNATKTVKLTKIIKKNPAPKKPTKKNQNSKGPRKMIQEERKTNAKLYAYFRDISSKFGSFYEAYGSQIQSKSERWFAVALLVSIYRGLKEEERSKLTDAQNAFFEKLKEEIKEPNCSSHKIEETGPNDEQEEFDKYASIKAIITEKVLSFIPEDEARQLTGSTAVIPQTIQYTGKIPLPKEASGNAIVGAVREGKYFAGDGSVITNEGPKEILFDGDSTAAEREHLESLGAPMSDDQLRLCAPIIDGTNKEELLKNMKKFSACIIQNVGLDKNLFNLETLKNLMETEHVYLQRQIPQHSSTNFCFRQGRNKQFSHEMIRGEATEGEVPFLDFEKNYSEINRETEETFEKLKEKADDEAACEEIIREFMKTLVKKSRPLKGQKKNSLILSFLSNLDLDDEKKFEKQFENIRTLPEFLQPFAGLLSLIKDEMPGINLPQMYLKEAGSRSTPHAENNGLGSVNINFGDGISLWFCVPFEFMRKYEDFVEKRMKEENENDKDKKEKDGENCLYKPYWPNELEILAEGIPLMKFEQKPGDIVVLNCGVYHWVQANGPCMHVAWNVAHETFLQLASAGIIHDHFHSVGQQSMVPIEHIAWAMAKKNEKVEKELFDLVKAFMMRSLAHAEMERRYLETKGIAVKSPSKGKFPSVCRCEGLGCSKRVLFSYFAHVPADETEKTHGIYCIKCIESMSESKPIFTMFEVNSIKKLVEEYDDYVYENLNDLQ